MALTLSLNTNPLVNRFAEPDDLIDAIAGDIRIRDIQLTHEFINPSWPAPVIRQMTRQMGSALRRTGARVTSGMTGPTGGSIISGIPIKRCGAITSIGSRASPISLGDLGGCSIGTQFAIFTYRDFDDPALREALIETAIDCWAEVADHAKSAGLEYVFWEPMSVGREFGETIAQAMALQDRLTAAGMAVPMWMMADIDHGDVTSPNPEDTDPYAWARAVPKVSPIIHIKQSMMDKSGHRPFTQAFNAKGRSSPRRFWQRLRQAGGRATMRSVWSCHLRNASRMIAKLSRRLPRVSRSGRRILTAARRI